MQTLLEEEQQRSRLLRQEVADVQQMHASVGGDMVASLRQANTSQVHSSGHLTMLGA